MAFYIACEVLAAGGFGVISDLGQRESSIDFAALNYYTTLIIFHSLLRPPNNVCPCFSISTASETISSTICLAG
jgi:hypothetical protein